MMTTDTREIQLASRPTGWPTADNFRLVETTLPDLEPGQVLVANTVMSVDPYMRGRMNDVKSYVPPFQLDAALDGAAVGEVVQSAAEGFEVGDTVLHGLGTQGRHRPGARVGLPRRPRHDWAHRVRRPDQRGRVPNR